MRERKTKNWWESRTIWLGFTGIAVAVLTAIQAGASWEGAVLAGFGALSVALRAMTTKPIGSDK